MDHTLWLFNIAMENGPFIDAFPIKITIYRGFSMAMLNNQMVNHNHPNYIFDTVLSKLIKHQCRFYHYIKFAPNLDF